MSRLRVAVVGGVLTYRALFDWLSPALFVSAMLATPVFQVAFFVSFGPAYSTRPPEFFALGNAVQTCAMAGIFGMAQTVANERVFGTLGHLMLSPADRAALYLGRALPHALTGVVISSVGVLLCWLLTDLSLGPVRLAALLVALLVASVSCTAIGLLLGGLGLVSRDTQVAASTAYLGLLLVSGAVVPVDQLPAPVRVLGEVVPLTHAVAAVRHLVAAGPDRDFVTQLFREGLVAAAVLTLGAVLIGRIERRARRRGDIDLF